MAEDTDNASEIANFTIWIYDHDDGYVTHNSSNEVNISPGQGFFVRSTKTNGNVTFKTSFQNQTSSNTFKKQAANTFIEVSMDSDATIRSTKIFYIENKTTGFDAGYDSKIFKDNSYSIFTEFVENNDGRKLGIQTLPKADFENMIVPIGVTAEAGKEIKFSINTTNFDTNLKIFLEDKETNTFTRLDEANTNYTITTTSPLTGSGRFYLHTTQAALSVDNDLNHTNTSVYKLDNTTLKIAGLPHGNANFAMYNMLGKKVMHTTFTTNSVKELALPKLAAGVYLVQLETANGKLNKKIILE